MKFSLLLALGLLATALTAPAAQAAGNIDCDLRYNLSGWSLFYKTASGTGTIQCTNGARIPVRIKINGEEQTRLRPGMSVQVSIDTSAAPVEAQP